MKTRKDIEALLPKKGENFDVIVVGGGPAGLGAAMAAAKQGSKTVLFEARGFFGGIATVSPWMPMNRILLNGGSRGEVHDIFVNTIKKYGPTVSVPGKQDRINGDNLDIHPGGDDIELLRKF